MRAVWRWQRARAKQLGFEGKLRGGAVGFLQLFGSALQLSPHLHVLVPEGQWSEGEGALVVLPPADDEEVEAVLHRLLRRLRAALAEVEGQWPEDEEEVLWAEAAQHRLALEVEAPRKKARRLAVALGFSLQSRAAEAVWLRRPGPGDRGATDAPG